MSEEPRAWPVPVRLAEARSPSADRPLERCDAAGEPPEEAVEFPAEEVVLADPDELPVEAVELPLLDAELERDWACCEDWVGWEDWVCCEDEVCCEDLALLVLAGLFSTWPSPPV